MENLDDIRNEILKLKAENENLTKEISKLLEKQDELEVENNELKEKIDEINDIDEIEVGEYVRTTDGIIGKVTNNKEIMPDNSTAVEIENSKDIFYYPVDEIRTHSKSIFEVIEQGDILDGHRVIDSCEFYVDIEYNGTYNGIFCIREIEDIGVILTHEQYDENSYGIEEQENEASND